MKRLALLAGMLLCCAALQAQFHVLHVQGAVLDKLTDSLIKVGQVLPPGSSIAMRSPDAELTVWSPEKGRMIARAAKPEEANAQSPYASIGTLLQTGKKASAQPVKPLLESQNDLVAYFKRGNYLFLGPSSIRVSPKAFKMDKDNVFFVTFFWENENTRPNTKLGFKGDSLLLDPAQFLNMNGRPVPAAEAKDFSISHYQWKSQRTEISSFKPVFPNMEALEKETESLIALIRASKSLKLDLKTEVYNFLAEAYGTPDMPVFKAWLKSRFGIE